MAAVALANSTQPALPGFLNTVGGYLSHYGYWAIFLLVMLEDFGVPVPGETILIAGAIFAGAGRMNVVAVGLIAFAAAVIGDNIGFAIGHFGGRALVLRWGKYVFITEERLDRAQAFFDQHGGKIIVVARFIEGLRQANGIIAGISGMHWRRFVAFNALGAALWVGTWVCVGYFSGQHITTIYHYITQYSLYVLIALAVLIVALIARYLVRRRRRQAADVRREQAAGGAVKASEHHDTGAANEAAEASGAVEAVEVEGAGAEGAGVDGAGVEDGVVEAKEVHRAEGGRGEDAEAGGPLEDGERREAAGEAPRQGPKRS